MAQRGVMRGVHTDNRLAKAATLQRRAAMNEEAALGQAYAKDKRLCQHVPYAKFRNIVRDLARKNDVSIRVAATSWVERWLQQADRLSKNASRAAQKETRVLPDGRKVFYCS